MRAPHEKGPHAQIEEAEKALYQVAETSKYGEGPLESREALRRAVEFGGTRPGARCGRISGVTSGFTDIDRLLGGNEPSDLVILAGRPGMGKTSLATNIAFHAARTYVQDMETGAEISRGAPILFFSLEMAAEQLSARILAEQTEIEMWKRFGTEKFSGKRMGEICPYTMQDLSTLPLYIDDTGGISIAQIAARARRMKREKNIGVIMIDHIQLVGSSRRAENRVQEITEITKGLKVLAKELNVPVIALSQIVARRG